MANTLKFGDGQWATKYGSTLAYNDENGNFKPLPFLFERRGNATRVNKEGLIEIVGEKIPRIDYLNDSNGALLLEPSRTNSFQQSNQFDTTWQANYTVLTSGQIGVGGSTDAWLLSGFTGTQEKRLRQYPPSSGTYAISVYAKAGTVDYLWLRGVTSNANKRTFFNLSTGQVGFDGSVSSNMVDMGDGWYRCEAVFNQQSGFEFYIGLSDTESAVTSTTGNIYIQNAQAEQGSYATSYIPTQGSAVTRLAESCSQTPPSGVIGQTEGVIYWEGIINGTENNFANIVTGERNTTTSFSVLHRKNPSEFQCSIFDGSTKGTCRGGSVVFGEKYKIAYAYKSGDFALYVNGVSVDTSTDTWSPPQTIDEIYIGDVTTYFGFKESNSHKDIRLYNTRLSNSELAALTQV